MIRILVESDHFLKILAVMLDPETPDEHRRAVADFFAHDVPDFLSDCEKFGAKIPGLYPARVTFAEDQADFEAKLPDADAVIVESFALNRRAVAKRNPLRSCRNSAASSRISIWKRAASGASPSFRCRARGTSWSPNRPLR